MKHYKRTRVMKPVIIVLMVLMLVVVTTAGCLWAPNLASLRDDIEQQLDGANLHKEIELTLGPVSLMFARLVALVIPDARVAGRYLSDVSRVEVGVYNLKKTATELLSMPEQLRILQENEGWELAVKARDDNDLVWVLYRNDGDRIKEVYVIVLDGEELVMVRAQGRFERLIGSALSEYREMQNTSRHRSTRASYN